ncbi:MAG: TspO protein [Caulobacter sp.]|nr:TspO protein [Caulobacter sp.]
MHADLSRPTHGAPTYASHLRGKAAGNIAIGLGLAAAAVITANLVSRHVAHIPEDPESEGEYGHYWGKGAERPNALVAMLWPPLYMALTLSGIKIWNAPASPQRSKALTLWGLIQGFNALWMAWGPRRLGGQTLATAASVGATAAYAWEASKVKAPNSTLTAPYAGWISMASVAAERLWKGVAGTATTPTVH